MKTIAIIPAKGTCDGFPGKNTRLFCGLPLFLHSVLYSLSEGVEPIVSTDSEEIIAICKERNIHFILETGDEPTTINCVRQVLSEVPCDVFAVLLPASPLRQPGLLSKMITACTEEGSRSAFSALRIQSGYLLAIKFSTVREGQDTTYGFYFFDGNISVTTRSFFEGSMELLGQDSRPFINEFPCSQLIGSETEFEALEHLALYSPFTSLLSKRVRKVCVVSNRPYFTRDYSDFIDSCDIVIRVNKMDNLYTQLTGSKTDITVVDCWKPYMKFPRQQRNTDILHKIPHVLFFPSNAFEGGVLLNLYLLEEKFTNWSFFPQSLEESTPLFTTVTRAIALAEYLYPEAKIYFLGDSSVKIRTCDVHGYNRWHTQSGDDNYQRKMITSGKMIPIMEENLNISTYRFSSCIPPEKLLNANKRILLFSPNDIPYIILNIQHPTWRDKLMIAGEAACRSSNDKDTATILNYTDTHLSLKWDKWGVEHFLRNDKGIYVLLK